MSQLNVNTIKNRSGKGGVSLPLGADSAGIVTATSLDSRQLIGDVNVGGALTITGNMTVEGTQTIINTSSLEVADKTVGVGSTSNPSDASANGAGLVVYGSTEKSLKWGTSGHKWTLEGGGLESSGINVTGVTTSTNVSVGQSVTATTFYGDGANLSNLPATAGAFTATASGAISAGDPVIINPDGTVSKAAIIAATAGSEYEWNTVEATAIEATWEPVNKKVVVAYRPNVSSRIRAVAGSVDASNKSITWGSIVDCTTANANFPRITATEDGKLFVVFYSYSDAKGRACVLSTSASDNSLTRNSSDTTNGTQVTDDTVYSQIGSIAVSWDTANNAGLVAYGDATGKLKVHRVVVNGSGNPERTGSQMSFGANYQSYTVAVSCESDASVNNGQALVLGQYSDTTRGARITNMNNSTPSSSSFEGVSTGTGGDICGRLDYAIYVPKYKVHLITGVAYGQARAMCQIISIENGQPENNGATKPHGVNGRAYWDTEANTSYTSGFPIGAVYNALRDCFVGAWRMSNSPYNGYVGQLTYDPAVGLSTFVGSPFLVHEGNTHYQWPVYDSTNGLPIFIYRDSSDGNDGQGIVLTSAYNTLTNKNWVGFSADTYSDSDTATIQVSGAISTQSGLTTLTDYYVINSGILTAAYTGDYGHVGTAYTGIVGRALNSTQLLINSPINTFG